MECKKCNGRGIVDNNKYWNAKARYNSDWYLQFSPTIPCRQCYGSGFVIGNIKEVIDLLQVIKNNSHKMYHREIDQCINVIKGASAGNGYSS